jgi:hypothetical protein
MVPSTQHRKALWSTKRRGQRLVNFLDRKFKELAIRSAKKEPVPASTLSTPKERPVEEPPKGSESRSSFSFLRKAVIRPLSTEVAAIPTTQASTPPQKPVEEPPKENESRSSFSSLRKEVIRPLSTEVAAIPTAQASTPPRKPLPFHLTFFGLPLELRDMIYDYIFASNGEEYIAAQLRGTPDLIPLTFSHALRSLLTSRQFYAEAFNIAYASTCFYWFQSHGHTSFITHIERFAQKQVERVQHVAFWSNPYLPDDVVIPERLSLTKLTVTSSYMSGLPQEYMLDARVQWLFRVVKSLPRLKELRFLTGCGISPALKTDDAGFAEKLRGSSVRDGAKRDDRVELGELDKKEFSFWLTIIDDSGTSRRVKLVIASIFELDRASEGRKKSNLSEEVAKATEEVPAAGRVEEV